MLWLCLRLPLISGKDTADDLVKAGAVRFIQNEEGAGAICPHDAEWGAGRRRRRVTDCMQEGGSRDSRSWIKNSGGVSSNCDKRWRRRNPRVPVLPEVAGAGQNRWHPRWFLIVERALRGRHGRRRGPFVETELGGGWALRPCWPSRPCWPGEPRWPGRPCWPCWPCWPDRTGRACRTRRSGRASRGNCQIKNIELAAGIGIEYDYAILAGVYG